MRKFTALLFALAALATGAESAAADTSASYTTVNYGGAKSFTCTTGWQAGVWGQYGAWGDYIDGCTVQLSCPYAYCTAYESTSIRLSNSVGHRVTQNARLRVLDFYGRVLRYRDRSCSGTHTCSNSDSIRVYQGEYASVQCNGVRQHSSTANWAYNSCGIQMNYDTY